MYMQGLGVTQDYKTALRWFKFGAEQGNVNAQFSLGILYGNGFGVTQDYARAGTVNLTRIAVFYV